MLALKAEYKAATGEDWKPPAAPPKAAPVKAASPPKKVIDALQNSVGFGYGLVILMTF